MPTNPATDELLSLVKSSHEQLEYLKELGVELGDLSRTSAATVVAKRVGITQSVNPDLNRPPSPVPFATRNPEPKVQTPPIRAALFQEPPPTRLPKSNETFEQIHAEIGDCTRCPLYKDRTHVVHTEGNRNARLMFIGEAPGADEDLQARPFVGRAGQLLTKIIEAIGYKREDVLIGNVNRCRPPGNRAPTAEEASMCKPFLLREIDVVQPEVIVVLGNTAMKNLLGTREGITRVRGLFQNFKGSRVMPTFHPAFLLRDPSKKRETWEDLKKVRSFLDENSTSGNEH